MDKEYNDLLMKSITLNNTLKSLLELHETEMNMIPNSYTRPLWDIVLMDVNWYDRFKYLSMYSLYYSMENALTTISEKLSMNNQMKPFDFNDIMLLNDHMEAINLMNEWITSLYSDSQSKFEKNFTTYQILIHANIKITKIQDIIRVANNDIKVIYERKTLGNTIDYQLFSILRLILVVTTGRLIPFSYTSFGNVKTKYNYYMIKRFVVEMNTALRDGYNKYGFNELFQSYLIAKKYITKSGFTGKEYNKYSEYIFIYYGLCYLIDVFDIKTPALNSLKRLLSGRMFRKIKLVDEPIYHI